MFDNSANTHQVAMFRYFIERAILKQNSARKKRTEAPLYEDIKTVLILFNAVDMRHIQKAKTTLLKDGKQVYLWGINHTSISYGHSQSTIMETSELNILGYPRKAYVDEFQLLEADIIVNMSREYSPALTYLMTLNDKIPVRVGYKGNDPLLYDFILDEQIDEHVDFLFKALLTFLGKN